MRKSEWLSAKVDNFIKDKYPTNAKVTKKDYLCTLYRTKGQQPKKKNKTK